MTKRIIMQLNIENHLMTYTMSRSIPKTKLPNSRKKLLHNLMVAQIVLIHLVLEIKLPRMRKALSSARVLQYLSTQTLRRVYK